MLDKTNNKVRIAYINVVGKLGWHRFLYKQCRGLAEKGYDVDFYTKVNREDECYGVKLKPVPQPKNRALRFFFSFKLLPVLKNQNYDIVTVVNPELLPLGLLLKFICRTKVVFDCQEDWISFIKHKTYLNRVAQFIVSKSLRFLLFVGFRLFDGVIFSDENLQRDFGSQTKAHVCFHNFPWLAMFPDVLVPWSQRNYDIIYPGTLSRTGGLFVMLNAIKLVAQRKSDLKCIFVGSLEENIRKKVEQFLTDNHLKDKVKFAGWCPYNEVPEFLNESRIGLVGLLDLPKFQKNIAGKIFDYMACGVVTISVDLPPERSYIIPDKCGYLVPPENPRTMADVIYKVLSDKELGMRLSALSRDHLLQNKYFAEHEIDKLVSFYRTVLW